MNRIVHFIGQYLVDLALAADLFHAFKRLGNDQQTKMALAAFSVAGMTLVQMRSVGDVQRAGASAVSIFSRIISATDVAIQPCLSCGKLSLRRSLPCFGVFMNP